MGATTKPSPSSPKTSATTKPSPSSSISGCKDDPKNVMEGSGLSCGFAIALWGCSQNAEALALVGLAASGKLIQDLCPRSCSSCSPTVKPTPSASGSCKNKCSAGATSSMYGFPNTPYTPYGSYPSPYDLYLVEIYNQLSIYGQCKCDLKCLFRADCCNDMEKFCLDI